MRKKINGHIYYTCVVTFDSDNIVLCPYKAPRVGVLEVTLLPDLIVFLKKRPYIHDIL